MGGKLYESVTTQPSSRERDLQAQIAHWKAQANKFREPSKVRFCERRMANYRDLLDAARNGQ